MITSCDLCANVSFRGVHARLNKLIIARLPFALPPYSDSPELYAIGIDRFALIYYAFEARWHGLIEQEKKGGLINQTAHEAKVQDWLADLLPSGLWRTKAVEADLSHLRKALGVRFDIGRADDNARNLALIRHIQTVTTEKPHVLIAYAWIMYMAIFSGGRWIRQQLLDAGPVFWRASDFQIEKSSFRSPRNAVAGFSLFYFEGERDGEDIKADFKQRLEFAEEILSAKERDDVVDEAQWIFEACIGLVDDLDGRLQTPASQAALASGAVSAKIYTSRMTASVTPVFNLKALGPLIALLAILIACLAAYAWL